MLLAKADAMADAAARVWPVRGEDPAPYMLLRSLATELTLKALLLEVKGKYPRVHALRALWGDLPGEVQDRLFVLHRSFLAAHRPGVDPDEADAVLVHLVDAAGDAFHLARYPMDHDVGSVPDPEPIRQVARGALLQRLRRAGRENG